MSRSRKTIDKPPTHEPSLQPEKFFSDGRIPAKIAANYEVLSALEVGIVIQAASGDICAANSRAVELLGLTFEQMQGRVPSDPRWGAIRDDGSPFPGEEHPGAYSLRTGLPQSSVVMGVQRPDKELLWVSISSQALFEDGPDAPSHSVSCFVDISDQKANAQNFERSRDDYRVLLSEVARQTQELSLLHRVRSALAQAVELPELLHTIVQAVADTFGFTLVSLYLVEDEWLTLQHQVGYSQEFRKIPITQGVSGGVVQSGQAVLLEDVRIYPGFLGAIEGIISEICVPLFDQGQVVGILNVESTQGVSLTQADLKLMTILAEYASIAIERARLYAAAQQEIEERKRAEQAINRQNDFLKALHETSLALMNHLQVDAVVQTILDRAVDLVGAESGFLDLVTPDEEAIEVRLGTGLYASFVGRRFKMGEGLAGKVWQTGEPLLVNDYAAWEGRSPHYAVVTRAVVAVPLKILDRVVGLIGLGYTQSDQKFTQDDLEVLSYFAALASIAYENARLFEAERQQRIYAQALADTRAALVGSLDLDAVLDQILGSISPVVPHSMANIMLIEAGKARVVRQRGYSDPELEANLKSLEFTVNDIDNFRDMVETGQSVIVTSRDGDPSWVWLTAQREIYAYMGVPIRSEGEVIGFINLDSDQPGAFAPEHTQQMMAFADQAAIALKNARLFAQVQERNRELDAFSHTVAHDLRSPLQILLGYADLLPEMIDSDTTPSVRDAIDMIHKYSFKMAEIIESLLLFAGLRNATVIPQPTELLSIVNGAVMRVENYIRDRQITISVAPDMPPVLGYGPWLEEVFANLIGNAVKYIGKDNPAPRIDIRAVKSGNSVRCEVQDNGLGIKLEDQQKLFDTFTRFHRDEESGYGLGLSIVQRIIARLGGKVGVQSAPGEGSTFWFTLPAA